MQREEHVEQPPPPIDRDPSYVAYYADAGTEVSFYAARDQRHNATL